MRRVLRYKAGNLTKIGIETESGIKMKTEASSRNRRGATLRWMIPGVIGLLFILTACGLTANRLSASPEESPAMQPEEVVESFYNWMLQYPGNPIAEGAVAGSPYVAPEFVDRLNRTRASFENEPGYDPVLCAQDVPGKVMVAPAEVAGETARVVVTTDFPNHAIDLELEFRDGEWVILRTGCMVQ